MGLGDVGGSGGPIRAGATEKLSFQIPVPPGKHLLGADTIVIAVPLGGRAGDLRVADLGAFASAAVAAQLAAQTHYVLAVEIRPDRPSDVLVRVLVPRFA